MPTISLNIFNSTSIDPFSSSMFLINHASDGIFAVGLVIFTAIVIYAISYYRTSDIGKSASISSVMVSFVSIILYYWGYSAGYGNIYVGEEFLSTILLFTIIIITILTITWVSYNKKGE